MRQYMHVGLATVLFFSFSIYSVDRDIAQSFAMAIEEMQAVVNGDNVFYKEMIRQCKSDPKYEYHQTRSKLKKAIPKALKSREIKSEVVHLVDLIIDNIKNKKDRFDGDAGDTFCALVGSFTGMVIEYSKIRTMSEKVLVLSIAICTKKIGFVLFRHLIEKMKAELRE